MEQRCRPGDSNGPSVSSRRAPQRRYGRVGDEGPGVSRPRYAEPDRDAPGCRREVVCDEDFCDLAVVSLDVWARMLAEGPTEGAERSRHICQLCAQLLGVTGAGISMVTVTGNRGIVCATDEVSARIEDLQFTLGEGACVEAVKGGVPVSCGPPARWRMSRKTWWSVACAFRWRTGEQARRAGRSIRRSPGPRAGARQDLRDARGGPRRGLRHRRPA